MQYQDLHYDIETLYIEGIGAKRIAEILECPIQAIYEWMDQENIKRDIVPEDLSPYQTINS